MGDDDTVSCVQLFVLMSHRAALTSRLDRWLTFSLTDGEASCVPPASPNTSGSLRTGSSARGSDEQQ